MGSAKWNLFQNKLCKLELKIKGLFVFQANIPFFHHSIVPFSI